MLEARKSRLFGKIFAVYNRNLLRRKFDSFHVANLDRLCHDGKVPQVILANHTGWWDGLVAFQLSMEAKLDFFVMMEEKQLRRFWPFTWLGAFSVVRDSPRSASRTIEYAADLLRKNSNSSLWVFPQGELVPFASRPMKLFKGFSRIVEQVGECRIVPLTIRYEFLKAHRPSIVVSIDSPFHISLSGRIQREELVDIVRQRLEEGEDSISMMIESGGPTDGYIDILNR
jgi:1-acyl-sn-glycerol-3-phosphate acyltransferase